MPTSALRSAGRAVARHGDDFAAALEQFDEADFRLRLGAGDDAEARQEREELFVGRLFERFARHFQIVRLEHADLVRDGVGGGRVVARHHLDVDACLPAARDGGGDVLADGVGEPDEPDEDKVFLVGFGQRLRVRGHRPVSERDGTDGLRRHGVQRGADFVRHRRAPLENPFGRAFGEENRAVGPPDEGGHPFAVRRKRQTVQHGVLRPQRLVIDAFLAEPKQERAFRRVARGMVAVFARFDFGCRIDGADERGRLLLFGGVGRRRERGLDDAHAVQRERTGFVGTNDGGRTDRLRRDHLADEVVVFADLPHSEPERDDDRERQSLRDGHDDDRHGDHEELHHALDGAKRLRPGRPRDADGDDDCREPHAHPQFLVFDVQDLEPGDAEDGEDQERPHAGGEQRRRPCCVGGSAIGHDLASHERDENEDGADGAPRADAVR